jgi:uncharacterized membrane protein
MIKIFLFIFISGESFNIHKGHVEKEEKISVYEEKEYEGGKIEGYKISFKEAIFSHIHNKLIHFPIVLSIFAFLFLLLSLKYREYYKAFRFLLFFLAVFTLPVYFSGESQIGFFEGKEKEEIAELHEELGIFSIIAIWLWFLFSFYKRFKIVSLIMGFIVIILIFITAFYGGIITH